MCLGDHPHVPVTVDVCTNDVPAAAEFVEHMQPIWKCSEENMLSAQVDQIARQTHVLEILAICQQRILSAKNIAFDTPSEFQPKYIGPL